MFCVQPGQRRCVMWRECHPGPAPAAAAALGQGGSWPSSTGTRWVLPQQQQHWDKVGPAPAIAALGKGGSCPRFVKVGPAYHPVGQGGACTGTRWVLPTILWVKLGPVRGQGGSCPRFVKEGPAYHPVGQGGSCTGTRLVLPQQQQHWDKVGAASATTALEQGGSCPSNSSTGTRWVLPQQ